MSGFDDSDGTAQRPKERFDLSQFEGSERKRTRFAMVGGGRGGAYGLTARSGSPEHRLFDTLGVSHCHLRMSARRDRRGVMGRVASAPAPRIERSGQSSLTKRLCRPAARESREIVVAVEAAE